MEKMTNKKALEFVLGLEVVVANEEVYQKLAKMLEQVEKKSNSGKTGKLTKEQQANEEIKLVILEVMADFEEPKQVKELLQDERLSEYTNQKLSALVRQLVGSGLVNRIEDKKVTRFQLV